MVKGISKQVIVLHSPDPQFFEQAIFILKEDALSNGGVTEDALLKEARRLISQQKSQGSQRFSLRSLGYVCSGALFTAMIWIVCSLF